MSYARRHSTNVCPGNRVRYTDLRIEDVEALVVRLLDFAVDEWLALEHAEEWPGNR